jgi:hypothetical protein
MSCNLIPTHLSKRRAPRARKNSQGKTAGPSNHAAGIYGIIRMNPKESQGSTKIFIKTLSNFTAITSTFAAESSNGFAFTAALINDVASLANVFDAYRFLQIEAIVTALTQPVATTGAVPGSYAQLALVVDYDDNAVITFANACDYSNCLVLTPGQSAAVKFVPASVNAALTSAAAATQNSLVEKQWFDFATTAAAHYGFKMVMSMQSNANIYHTWFVRFVATVECRYAR